MTDWIKKIKHSFIKEPKTQQEVISELKEATHEQALSPEIFNMIEGVLQIAKMQASDVMVPKSNMIVIKDTASLPEIIAEIVESAHSRYPIVSAENPDEVLGILLAKDLLAYGTVATQQAFLVKNLMRQVLVVPETKHLDVLLREFRATHNHLAIVVDEHATVLGLVTIEDVLEEIVGEIEDEYDLEEDEVPIKVLSDQCYQVDAKLELDEFNAYFSKTLSNEAFNTIGGVVMHAFAHMPSAGETLELEGLKFTVLQSDERQIYSLKVQVLKA